MKFLQVRLPDFRRAAAPAIPVFVYILLFFRILYQALFVVFHIAKHKGAYFCISTFLFSWKKKNGAYFEKRKIFWTIVKTIGIPK